MQNHTVYDGVIDAPMGKLGINMQGSALAALHFLPADTALVDNALIAPVAAQLAAYFANPEYLFTHPIQAAGTPYQQRVWNALCEIPCGTTLTYGELAKKLNSSPRAIGQACRNNPTPVIVPCHRVVGVKGLGGYAGESNGNLLAIKGWLLLHERQNISIYN